MRQELSHLLEQLEGIDLRAATSDAALLAQALETRGAVIAQLQEQLASERDEATRKDAVARLSKVFERDRQAEDIVRAALSELRASLDSLVSGRAAARGYGAAQPDSARPPTRRVG